MSLRLLAAIAAMLAAIPATAAESYTIADLAVGKVELVQCPAVSEDFAQLLAKVDALKASIKNEANCKEVARSVDRKLGGLQADREGFLDLIKKAQAAPLSDAESKAVADYASSVTERISALIDLITQSNHCFQDNAGKEALTSLSGFVSEAASLLSSVAGPWGAPISIGGQIISGFLTGLDKVIKSRVGYDFNDQSQWMSYVQTLCTYYALRQDVQALLHPEERIAELQSIGRKLDLNMSSIATTDPKNSNSTLLALNGRIKNAQIWIQREIEHVQTEANSYWNNVTGKAVLSQAAHEIEDFLVQKEGPNFLNFELAQSERHFKELAGYLFRDGADLLHLAHQANLTDREPPKDNGVFLIWPSGDEAPVYKALTGLDWRLRYKELHRADDELGFRLNNGRKIAINKFDTAAWAFGVTDVFCDFFQQSDLYSWALQSVCTSQQYKKLDNTITRMIGNAPRAWRAPVEANAIRASSWTDALDMWTTEAERSLAPYSITPR